MATYQDQQVDRQWQAPADKTPSKDTLIQTPFSGIRRNELRNNICTGLLDYTAFGPICSIKICTEGDTKTKNYILFNWIKDNKRINIKILNYSVHV